MLFNVENQHKLVFYVGLCGFLLIFVCQPSIVCPGVSVSGVAGTGGQKRSHSGH